MKPILKTSKKKIHSLQHVQLLHKILTLKPFNNYNMVISVNKIIQDITACNHLYHK